MRPYWAFALLVCTTILATAQSVFDPHEFLDKKDLRLADVNQLWRTLRISGTVRETTAEGAKNTSRTFDCSSDDHCEAQYGQSQWSLDGAEAMIRISPAYLNANLSRFLLLHREDGGVWRLVDYLDLTEWDYNFPEASVASSDGQRWLVVTAWPHCGTGCSLKHTDWYELKNGKLRLVLTVPLSGYEVQVNPGRQFETRFVRASHSGVRETLEFLYHIEFVSGLGSSVDTVLWHDEKFIRFSRTNGRGEFKFDSARSEASAAYVEQIFSPREAGNFQDIDAIQDHLLEIARGPNGPRREWLKELLDEYPDAVPLARARAALAKSP